VAGSAALIPLDGTTGGGATIVSAWISALPALGVLFQVRPGNSTAATEAGPIALQPDGTPAPLWSLAVAYKYSGTQSKSSSTDDAFDFIVGDDQGGVSAPATAHISTRPPPTPAPTQVPKVKPHFDILVTMD
jgi:hypothetical protein